MRIVQITDMHVGRDGRYAAGVDVDANFERAVSWIAGVAPDMVVCTGDIACEAENEAEATGTLERLVGLAPDFYAVPGNHDEPGTLQAVAACLGVRADWPFAIRRDGARMLFLDTADGTAGEAGRKAIRSHAVAASQSHEEFLVFMHHPPAVTGCTSLDEAVPLSDRDETTAVLESLGSEFHVFCGHFHTSGSSPCGKGWVHRTGAVSFTVPCDAQSFRLEHSRPCLRVIEIADGAVSTEHIELS